MKQEKICKSSNYQIAVKMKIVADFWKAQYACERLVRIVLNRRRILADYSDSSFIRKRKYNEAAAENLLKISIHTVDILLVMGGLNVYIAAHFSVHVFSLVLYLTEVVFQTATSCTWTTMRLLFFFFNEIPERQDSRGEMFADNENP